MGKKLYPTSTLKQAQSILSAWEFIDPTLEFGSLTMESFAEDVARVTGLKDRLMGLQHELMEIRHQRDTASIDLWKKVKGMRSVIKIVYGDDSTAYELAGGTRRSERKKPRRRTIQDSPK